MRRGALRRGQRFAEKHFPDTCRVERSTGAFVFNSVTGQNEQASTTVYEGRCKFQSAGAGSTPDAGGVQFTVVRNECHIPFGAVAVLEDDVITCVTSGNPQLVGAVFRVTGFAVESYATAARVPVERNQ